MRLRTNRDMDGRLLGAAELQAYINMGRNGARRVAEEAGAVIRIGNRVLYDRLKIDAYLDQLREAQKA